MKFKITVQNNTFHSLFDCLCGDMHPLHTHGAVKECSLSLFFKCDEILGENVVDDDEKDGDSTFESVDLSSNDNTENLCGALDGVRVFVLSANGVEV